MRFLLLAPHKQNARVLIFALFVIGTTKKRICTDFILFVWHHTKQLACALFGFCYWHHTKEMYGTFFCTDIFLIHTTSPRCECIFEVLDTTREVLSVKRYPPPPHPLDPLQLRANHKIQSPPPGDFWKRDGNELGSSIAILSAV